MNKIFVTTMIILGGMLSPTISYAAQCSGNSADSTDPACWTSVTTGTTIDCEITCDSGGSGHVWCKDSCRNGWSSPMIGSWYCTNGSCGWCPTSDYTEAGDDVTTYTCHYRSSVLSWSSCDGSSQLATSFNWNTTSGTSCSHVSSSRACTNGACGTADGEAFSTNAGVVAAERCAVGSASAVTLTGTKWNWDCLGLHGSTASCTAKREIDIGLKIRDDETIVPIAAEPFPPTSPLRISKDGLIYGILLVPSGDAAATHIMVETETGPLAIKKYE